MQSHSNWLQRRIDHNQQHAKPNQRSVLFGWQNRNPVQFGLLASNEIHFTVLLIASLARKGVPCHWTRVCNVRCYAIYVNEPSEYLCDFTEHLPAALKQNFELGRQPGQIRNLQRPQFSASKKPIFRFERDQRYQLRLSLWEFHWCCSCQQQLLHYWNIPRRVHES